MEPTTTLPAARIGLVLLASGAIFLVAGVLLLLAGPFWAGIVALAIGATDAVLGMLYRTGRLGPAPPQALEAAEQAHAEPDRMGNY